jgi:pimeloyl-ACP methyl ester carboxylesterase
MPTVHANGIDIWYERLGPSPSVAQGPSPERLPLVLTHGFAGPSGHWRPEVVPLAEKRPLILYDVRGHGRTSVPHPYRHRRKILETDDSAEFQIAKGNGGYSLPIFAADLAALLEAIGIERAHVGGVSMGGMITAQFAVDYPEMCASVLLCDTTCGNAPACSEQPEEPGAAAQWEQRLHTGITLLSHSVREHGLEETLRREFEWKKANDPHLDESPYNLEEDLDRIKLMTVEGYLGAANAIATRPDLTERISKIATATLVMIGEWDDFLPCAVRDHELIPGSRLVVRQRCAHGSRWRLETFLSEIEAFLDDVEAGRSVAGERVV